MGPCSRNSSGPADMCSASTGRTHACTRPSRQSSHQILAKRRPSTHAPRLAFVHKESLFRFCPVWTGRSTGRSTEPLCSGTTGSAMRRSTSGARNIAAWRCRTPSDRRGLRKRYVLHAGHWHEKLVDLESACMVSPQKQRCAISRGAYLSETT